MESPPGSGRAALRGPPVIGLALNSAQGSGRAFALRQLRRRSAPIIESWCYPLNLTWTIFPTFIAIAGENFRLSGSGSAS